MTGNRITVPARPDEPAAIYVHIPFCRYVCPYCDFNVYAKQEELVPDYLAALEREMALIADFHAPSGPSPTLFIGGGTPSLLDPAQVAQIIEAAARTIGLAAGAEVTMESNPDNLNEEYCRGLLGAGVNRLSIGVQSHQASGLKVLGRLHGRQGSDRAVRAARAAGIENMSLDFIYGWPGQTLEQWKADLVQIAEWQPDHLSLYALIVEAGTPYETAVRRGSLVPTDDDTTAMFFDVAVDHLGASGWDHYEISNWARSESQRSIHNLVYWRNGQYYGIGAGTHSYLGSVRASNTRLPATYIDATRSRKPPIAATETITPEMSMGESMILGLRLLRDGVSRRDFRARHGVSLEERYGDLLRKFEQLGLMEQVGDSVRLSAAGAMVSNGILAEFLL